jgi:spore germination protein YaaH
VEATVRRFRTACIGAGIASLLLLAVPAMPVQGATSPATASTTTQRDPALGPHAREDAGHAQLALHLTPARGSMTPRALQPRASTNSQLFREVFGFAPYWALSQNANWNYSLLSTVAYFGLTVNGDGNFNTTDQGWTGWTSQNLTDTVNRAHQAGARAVVVVKAFNNAGINAIVSSSTARQTLITNTINAIAQRGLDGVNVDFEGSSSSGYPNLQADFTSFMGQLSTQVHQRWPSAMVSVDTYSGSASWDGGFFNIGALAPNVDAFFIMAYDMASGNMSGHAGPNAPLYGWTYNDTTSVGQYLGKAPASKVILGVPYYAYKWSTTSNQPYASIVSGSGATATPYSQVLDDLSCGAQQLTQSWDSTAQSPWASWWSPPTNDPCQGNHNSWRELYFDNAASIAKKYDLVNANNLRGAGMWALGYEGSSQDLWNAIAGKFVVTYAFKGMYTVDVFGGIAPDASSVPVDGHGYWPNWPIVRSGALLPDASGGYTLDGYGGLHQFGAAAPVTDEAYWRGWNIARDVVLLPASTSTQPSGYTLDGWGGLHPFGGAPATRGGAMWPNWDIAKRIALLSDGSGGYILDGWGGLHPFAVGANPMPPSVAAAFWPNWNIARDIALTPGSTAANVSGVTLDGFGGVHPFGGAGATYGTAYWGNWDIARAVRLSPDSTAAQPRGWMMDGWGGIHPFGGAPTIYSFAYWPNHDVGAQLLVE